MISASATFVRVKLHKVVQVDIDKSIWRFIQLDIVLEAESETEDDDLEDEMKKYSLNVMSAMRSTHKNVNLSSMCDLFMNKTNLFFFPFIS